MNSKALESFLIPEEIAIEGLSEKTKGNLTIGAIGVAILAVIGLKISDYKKDKIYKSQVKSNNEMKKKNLEVVNNKYKLSTMSENEYKQFINRIKKESESYVKQMVNKANHDSEYIKSVRNEFIERNKNPDTGELESYDKETLKYIKSGYFTSNWNREGYWEIIEDQDVATSGCDLHCDIAEALNTKYSELSAANIVWFSFGDGDEGCVYFGHISYENMKKKFNEVGISIESFLIPEVAEEGIISNFKARRAKRKIEKIANKMDNDEKRRKFKEDSKKYLPVIKKIMEDTINQLKKKYPKAPVNPYFYNEDEFIEVSLYDNEFVTNSYSEDYIEDAEKLFDEAYSIIKNKIENYKSGFGTLTLKVEIPENNCIEVKFY